MDNKDSEGSGWWQEPVATFSEVTGMIALPVIGAIFLGQYLDEKWSSEPWATVGCVLAGIGIAGVAVWRLVKRYRKQEGEK